MSTTEFKPCILIPSYNHSDYLPALLGDLEPYGLDTVIVDDGSVEVHEKKIQELSSENPKVKAVRLNENQGKGGAVMAGLKWAHDQGYSHSIQIDSDGQHDLSSLNKLIETSKKNPERLISGAPVYGDDVPGARKWGRLFTMLWVWIETLSFQLKDVMCGFRSYPLKNCMPIIKNRSLGRAMDFDIEVMVRYFWTGKGVKQFPVKVNYPEDGKSHFRMFKDNVLISWMHTRLVTGMILRLPVLLYRKVVPPKETRWSEISETGWVMGIKILLGIYRMFGRRFFQICLYPVLFYYFTFNIRARKASKDYLDTYRAWCEKNGETPKDVTSFGHINQFANMMLDRITVWMGDIVMSDLDFPNQLELHSNVLRGQGMFFISGHYGNIEICRALGQNFKEIKVNVLVYHENAKKFNSVISEISENSMLNLISVKECSVDTAIMIREKIERGEWVYIMGHRVSLHNYDKNFKKEFLGREASFPMGPFILAELMGAPIHSMFCYRDGDKFAVRTKLLTSDKKSRNERMSEVLDGYVLELEEKIKKDPLQWFNFFHFWDV